jgi:chromosome segregation ATPase
MANEATIYDSTRYFIYDTAREMYWEVENQPILTISGQVVSEIRSSHGIPTKVAHFILDIVRLRDNLAEAEKARKEAEKALANVKDELENEKDAYFKLEVRSDSLEERVIELEEKLALAKGNK